MTTIAPAGPPAQPSPPAPRRPRTLRTVLVAVGSVALVALLALVVLQVVAGLDRGDRSRTSTVTEPFASVSIDASAADVRVEQADVDATRIVFRSGGSALRETHAVHDGELEVELRNPSWGILDLPFGSSPGAELVVQVPAGTGGAGMDVDVSTAAGGIVVAGDFRDVDVDSGAGEVRLSGSVADLEVESGAGDLTADGLRVSGEVRATSGAGDTELDLATAPTSMRVETTAGEQRILLPEGAYAITTETVMGQVSNAVGSDADATRRYVLSATMGDITVDRR
ncbi:DUF4097 family beta strand repeat-containing protein [Clavibacter zhangzhiyongii]|uniref:DUF4097 family beta strand repeat protein n=1 Tax=Clavibacter zhangzhiyongii TaxID=2768071 RepID=A0A7L7Z2R8_9MICO|nr:DUF4097 family beta strand repeat-containing protein [Clavibacter zhangzhiyongii]QOD43971.1 DUF4097 family beta strand repeat protein [Clavibacter zhangzhiyongii]